MEDALFSCSLHGNPTQTTLDATNVLCESHYSAMKIQFRCSGASTLSSNNIVACAFIVCYQDNEGWIRIGFIDDGGTIGKYSSGAISSSKWDHPFKALSKERIAKGKLGTALSLQGYTKGGVDLRYADSDFKWTVGC